MSSRVLLVVVATLVLLVVGLMSGPAFSGEHPWDSDRTGGVNSTMSGSTHDTAVLVSDTISINVLPASTATAAPVWTSLASAVWSAMMIM